MTERTATLDGSAFPLAGRTRATVKLTVARLTNILVAVIGGSADGVSWDTLLTLGANAVGVQSKSSTAAPPDFTVQPWHRYVRASLTTITDAVAEVELSAPFVDTTNTDDAALFSQEMRGFQDGFARIVGAAEDDVIGQLMRSAGVPRQPTLPGVETLPIWSGAQFGYTDRYGQSIYDTNPNAVEPLSETPDELIADARFELPGYGDAVRGAIVVQAEHRFRRYKLEQQNDPTSIKTLRDMPELAPGLMRQLDKYRNTAVSIFRGR